MRRPSWLEFDLRPLGHPAWWAALVLLGANDQLLKRAHLLPGWLTGKLSDFAFLIVAPVLAACLIPTAVRRRRGIALIGVGGLFAVAKVWAPISQALVALLRQAGVVWRLWPDPSDLVALAMLPLAARLMRWRGTAGLRLPERAGALLGALACVATSALPSYLHNPFLLNAAPGPITVKVTWLLRDVPCPEPPPSQPINGSLGRPNVAADLAATLTSGDLDDPIAFELQRGQVAALDGPPPRGISPGGVCTVRETSPLSQCVGVVLDAPPAAPVLVVGPASWREGQSGGCGDDSPPPVFQCAATLDPDSDPGPDAVTLKTVGGTLQFVVAGRFSAAVVDLAAITARTPPSRSCRQVRDDLQQLLAADQTCTIDADCLAYNPPPVVGLPPVCAYEVNIWSLPQLNSLEAAWSAACLVTPPSCGVGSVAVCRRGLCASATQAPDASVEHGGEAGMASDGAAGDGAAGDGAAARD